MGICFKKSHMQKTAAILAQPTRFLTMLFGELRREVQDWPQWWDDLSTARKITPVVSVFAYWAGLFALKGFRSDHWSMGILLIILYYGGRKMGALLKFAFPVLLTGILYDSMRFYSDYIRGAIHVAEPYLFDKKFFGIQTATGILTPNEWLQNHTHSFLDFITGLAYLTFIGVFVLTSAYVYFWLAGPFGVGTKKYSKSYIQERRSVFGWSFFWVNMVGYSTYYWYPAAPPWYVSLYGLGPVRMDALPNPAGCLRFDQLLGTHFFTQMYGRSADVFGAIPSLHVAYPLISVYFAFRFGTLRVFSVLFYGLMCFSAVYLNHHYILDILWGSSYAIMTAVVLDLYFGERHKVKGY